MLISFTGAQSTGKSTLLEICKGIYPDFYYVDEVTRRVQREQGVQINDNANNYNTTQVSIIEDHLNNLKLRYGLQKVGYKNVVLDRCIFDGYVYTKYLYQTGKVSEWCYEHALEAFVDNNSKYDVVFYTDPDDVELEDDGVRSTDVDFRNRIIDIYEGIDIESFKNVIKLSGTPQERWDTFKLVLNLK